MTVKLISVTPDAEQTMAYIARVSNPSNQNNEKYSGLLKYCIKHNHWSVFEQSTMTLEIETTRAIAAQILRHRSFTYQEFSQRYADSSMLSKKIALPELRRQDDKNRQNSIDDLDPFVVQSLELQMQTLFDSAMALYQQMLERGVGKRMCSYGASIMHSHTNLHDRFMSFMDSLHHSEVRTWHSERAYGNCRSM